DLGAPPPPFSAGGPPPPPGGPAPFSGGPEGVGASAPPPPPPNLAPAPHGAALAPAGAVPTGAMQIRNPVPTWLLCFIPFVALFWFYRANKEIEAWSGGRIPVHRTSSLLALTIGVYALLVPPIIAWNSYMGRIREAQR